MLRIAFAQDPRDDFAISPAPASILRSSLEVKTLIARQNGQNVAGDSDLLVEFAGLDDAPVIGGSTETTDEHVIVYLRADSHEVVGTLRISKA